MRARLLIDPPASGPRNMAVDEALLASSAAGAITLRVYAWQPATLSLGYFQAAQERAAHVASRDCAVVRRASGGGAILHDQELTYSLTMPCADRFGNRAAEVYRSVHRSLIETLATWNINAKLVAELTPADVLAATAESDPFLCFLRRSPEDIVVAGAKIVGSAQRRHSGALLQHGSVLLARSRFAPELPGLAEVAEHLPAPICFDLFLERWLPILQQSLSLSFTRGSLTASEEVAANEWESDRFATDEWTNKR